MSLAATISRAARTGARIELLTVFAGDPGSDAPAGGWDRRGGFATEGEAAAARRVEDREACRLVGAEPMWLPLSVGGYRPARDEKAIWAEIAERTADADAVLVPGSPLVNEDHLWLSGLLLGRRLPCRRLALYREQPYRYMWRGEPSAADVPESLLDGLQAPVDWTRAGAVVSEYRRKATAIRAYASQLPMLGLTTRRIRLMLLHEALRGGEALAWLRG